MDREKLENELIRLRRELHRHPEAGWTEFYTTVRIIEELQMLGLEVQYGPSLHNGDGRYGVPGQEVLEACLERALSEGAPPELVRAMAGGYTGCTTVIEGALPGPTVGIRVDIDCNEVRESTDPEHAPQKLGFASEHPGLMHACGHDAHAAIGIGAARILAASRDRLRGRVLLAFQPAEEGLRGAASMTDAGVYAGCDYFFGGHVGIIPGQETGTVFAGCHGFLSSTKLDAVFHGRSAHAGLAPEQGCNALAAAAAAVNGLLAIPRHSEGASRINVGSLHAEGARNAIPAEARMELETRGAGRSINEYMEASARRVLQAAAEMYGCSCEILFMGSAGDAQCDPALVERAAEILSGVPGVERVLKDGLFGAGEDVTTIMRAVQAGGGKATEMVFGMPLKSPHHSSTFDVDENVIMIGAESMAALALGVGSC